MPLAAVLRRGRAGCGLYIPDLKSGGPLSSAGRDQRALHKKAVFAQRFSPPEVCRFEVGAFRECVNCCFRSKRRRRAFSTTRRHSLSACFELLEKRRVRSVRTRAASAAWADSGASWSPTNSGLSSRPLSVKPLSAKRKALRRRVMGRWKKCLLSVGFLRAWPGVGDVALSLPGFSQTFDCKVRLGGTASVWPLPPRGRVLRRGFCAHLGRRSALSWLGLKAVL